MGFLHLGKCRCTLAPRELLDERAAAADAIAQMENGKCVGARRIVRPDGIEVLGDKEDRSAGNGLSQTRLFVRPCERFVICLLDPSLLPSGNSVHCGGFRADAGG